MNALRFLLSLPFRLFMIVCGIASAVTGVISVVFLVIGTGVSMFLDAFGGDRS